MPYEYEPPDYKKFIDERIGLRKHTLNQMQMTGASGESLAGFRQASAKQIRKDWQSPMFNQIMRASKTTHSLARLTNPIGTRKAFGSFKFPALSTGKQILKETAPFLRKKYIGLERIIQFAQEL